MNRLYYSCKFLFSKFGFCLFIMIELTVLFTIANLTQAQHNSRTMLYDPFAPYIEKQGFLSNLPMTEEMIRDPKVDIGECFNQSIEMVKKISGAKVLEMKTYHDFNIDITVVPDEVFDNLRLPLQSGKYFNSGDKSNDIQLIATADSQYTQDQTFKLNDKDFKISAILTNPTYIPQFVYELGMSYEQLYMNYESDFYDKQPYAFTSESMLKNNGIKTENLSSNGIVMIYFDKPISDSEYKSIEQKFNDMGMDTIQNAEIAKRSNKILKDDLMRLFPPVAAFSAIVFIGIISCSLMITKSMMHKLSVLCCSGATKLDCVIISMLQMLILMLCSLILTAVSLAIINYSVLSNKIGFVIKMNNLKTTAFFFVVCICVSMISPVFLISRSDPRELLTKTSE